MICAIIVLADRPERLKRLALQYEKVRPKRNAKINGKSFWRWVGRGESISIEDGMGLVTMRRMNWEG